VDLCDKLAALAHTMSDAERATYKLLLGMAAGGLARKRHSAQSETENAAFLTTIRSISRLQPHRHRVPPNGVVYRGRPDFVTDELLGDLQDESARLRQTAVRFDDHFVVSGAPLAHEVAFSPQLNGLISAHADYVSPTAQANYLYYDDFGLGIDPHIDNESFALNAILMLQHTYEGRPSALVLYPPHSVPERILLSAGEMLVLYADSIVHERERVAQNECISIVAFGFYPVV
jgi:hypothetical protein